MSFIEKLEFKKSGNFIVAEIPKDMKKMLWLDTAKKLYKALMSHKDVSNMQAFAVCGSSALKQLTQKQPKYYARGGSDIFIDACCTHKTLLEIIANVIYGDNIKNILDSINVPTYDRINLSDYNIILQNPYTLIEHEDFSIRKLGVFFKDDTVSFVTTEAALNDIKHKQCHYPIYYALDPAEAYDKLKQTYPAVVETMSQEDIIYILDQSRYTVKEKSDDWKLHVTEKTDNFEKRLKMSFRTVRRYYPIGVQSPHKGSDLYRSFVDFSSTIVRNEYTDKIAAIEKFDRKELIEYAKTMLKDKKPKDGVSALFFALSEKKIIVDDKEDDVNMIMVKIYANKNWICDDDKVLDMLLTIIEGAFTLPGQTTVADELVGIADTLAGLADKLK